MGTLNDNIKAVGMVNVVLTSPTGEVKEEVTVSNLVVTIGKIFLANALVSTTKATFGYMAVGSGITPAALADTALQTEVIRLPLNKSTLLNAAQFVGTFPPGFATGSLSEAGILDQASGGDLLSHVVFPVVNKGIQDTLIITWTITIG